MPSGKKGMLSRAVDSPRQKHIAVSPVTDSASPVDPASESPERPAAAACQQGSGCMARSAASATMARASVACEARSAASATSPAHGVTHGILAGVPVGRVSRGLGFMAATGRLGDGPTHAGTVVGQAARRPFRSGARIPTATANDSSGISKSNVLRGEPMLLYAATLNPAASVACSAAAAAAAEPLVAATAAASDPIGHAPPALCGPVTSEVLPALSMDGYTRSWGTTSAAEAPGPDLAQAAAITPDSGTQASAAKIEPTSECSMPSPSPAIASYGHLRISLPASPPPPVSPPVSMPSNGRHQTSNQYSTPCQESSTHSTLRAPAPIPLPGRRAAIGVEAALCYSTPRLQLRHMLSAS